MRKLLFSAIILISAFALADTPQQVINRANEAYSRSEYSYAAELYEEVLAQGLEAAELYYNLGNAYFKSNRMGKAILNYERALRLNPSAENIRYNLELANNRTVDSTEQRPLLFYEKWWQNTYNMQSAGGWAITGLIFLTVFFILTALYLFAGSRSHKQITFYTGLLFFVLTCFSFVFAQKQHNRVTADDIAIIMSPRVAVKSAPSAQSPDLFLVHEGTKVTIRNQLGEWLEIHLPNGNVGWIKKETLDVI